MNGNSLKSRAEFNKLSVSEKEHLSLSIASADRCLKDGSALLPTGLATIGDADGKSPIAFNQASLSNPKPPSKRMEAFGFAGRHTFYCFKPGREAE